MLVDRLKNLTGEGDLIAHGTMSQEKMNDLKKGFMETKRVLPTPRKSRVTRGDDESATPIRIFMFGEGGTGKTFSINALLEKGYKVLVVNTDLGGSGLSTVKLYIRNVVKNTEVLKNLYEIVLNDDDEVQQFVEKPESFFPEIYDVDPDFLVWDGYSIWQQSKLKDKIGDMPMGGRGGKEVNPAVAAGMQFEMAQWGMLTSVTLRTLDKFCSLNNKKTGKVWHKIVTALEGVKMKEGAQGLYETKEPALQGAGGFMSNAAFDLVLRCKKTTVLEGKESVEKFWYQVRAENKKCKNRGFILNAVEPGDMGELWKKIKEQANIA